MLIEPPAAGNGVKTPPRSRRTGRRWEAQASRGSLEQRLGEVRESVRAALTDFARERAGYFEQVESEVVQLALSIARKILRREAQIDPLLLAGMVRVALDRVEERAPRSRYGCIPSRCPSAAPTLRNTWRLVRSRRWSKIPSLPADHCILQTELGTTELGPEIPAQGN